MPFYINTPDVPWAEQDIVLSGVLYKFIYSLNTRDNRVRLSIYLDSDPVLTGIKIMENQDLLGRYNLNGKFSGTLACVRTGSTKDPVTLSNLGLGKDYQLLYYGDDEVEVLSV